MIDSLRIHKDMPPNNIAVSLLLLNNLKYNYFYKSPFYAKTDVLKTIIYRYLKIQP